MLIKSQQTKQVEISLIPKVDGYFNKLFVLFVVTLIGVSFCFYSLGIHSHKQIGQDNIHQNESQNEQQKGTEATGKILVSLIFGCVIFIIVNIYINWKKQKKTDRKTNFMSKYKKELQHNSSVVFSVKTAVNLMMIAVNKVFLI